MKEPLQVAVWKVVSNLAGSQRPSGKTFHNRTYFRLQIAVSKIATVQICNLVLSHSLVVLNVVSFSF